MKYEKGNRTKIILWFLVLGLSAWLSVYYLFARNEKIEYEKSFSSLNQVQISFEALDIGGGGAERSLSFSGRVENNSRVPVSTGSSSLFVNADGLYLGAGSLKTDFSINPGNQRDVEFSIELGEERSEKLENLLRRGEVRFELSGVVNIRGRIKENFRSLKGLRVREEILSNTGPSN